MARPRKIHPSLLSVSRSRFPSELINDSSKRGELAAPKVLFGECSRFAVAPIHTRFGSIVWFVWDAEHEFSTLKAAEVIRQENSFEEAVVGLN